MRYAVPLLALVCSLAPVTAMHAHTPVQPGADQVRMLEDVDARLAANKHLVYDFWREVLEGGHLERADAYLNETYIQHNPNVPDGREGFKTFFSPFAKPKAIEARIQAPLVAIVADGDLVVLSFAKPVKDPADPTKTYTTTWFDMFRIQSGKIAEHWDCATKEPAPAPLAAGAYRDLFEYDQLLTLFTQQMQAPSLDGFEFLHTGYKVTPVSPQTPRSDIHIVIKAKAGDIALTLDDNGTLHLPLSDALEYENPRVVVNQPKGSVALSPLPAISAPPTQHFDYRLRSRMSAEYSTWLQKLNDEERAQMPHADALVIRFPAGVHASATVALGQATQRLDSDAQGEIRIAANSAWEKTNPSIALSAQPASIELRLR